ncbi:MAG: diaminopimelate epimerase [Candidatus Ratteibacteria bacterium]|nr:diaminopimelate epimerase [Candidatus Ratteibacteria bacterium]
MELNFTKMTGSGNDFIVIDNRSKILDGRESEIARQICRRKFSVGADGLLLIENSERADFRMRIFNPDGSEPEMCGNGARCTALYANLEHIASSKMNFETIAGVIFAEINDNSVRINMGKVKDLKLDLKLSLESGSKIVHYLNVGVPHAVLIEEALEDIPVNEMGSRIRFHRQFHPGGTNVDFIELKDKETVQMRTYERGVEGETLACGTGAIASAVIAHLLKGLTSPVRVLTQSGEILTVYLEEEEGTLAVALEGKTGLVYKGKIII